jgi:DNA-binding transcriptional LysR family regulator
MHATVLRYVKEVARLGSVRKAAQVLNVASSAINRQIIKIETELGVKLFDRLPGGMQPTAAGEILLRHVRSTLYDYDRLLSEIDGLRGIRTGHVRIAATDSLVVDFLPQAVTRFSQSYPAVTYTVMAAAPAGVIAEIGAGHADIGITFAGPIPPSVQLVANVPMPGGVVMAPHHPLARRNVLKFSDLEEYPVISQKNTLPVETFMNDIYEPFRARATQRIYSNSIEFIKKAVENELGVAFYTRLAFYHEIRAGRVVWVPLAHETLEALKLGLFTPTQRMLAPATEAMVGVMVEMMQALE